MNTFIQPGTSAPKVAAPTSIRIIAAAVVFAGIYFASSIVITLIVSLLIAFVLEPGVRLLERIWIPRWLGSLLMVLVGLALVYLLIYLIYDRVTAFVDDLPRLAIRIKQLVTHYQIVLQNLSQRTAPFTPSNQGASLPTVRVQQESPWARFLLRGIGSVYAFTVTVMFIPFLIFFMLAAKDHFFASTLNLFSMDRRNRVKIVIDAISVMVRQYVIGNILVALISTVLITPAFMLVQLRYALVLGPLSALLNLVPYIGVALAIIPPLLIALMQYDTMGPYIAIAVAVLAIHFIAINVLTPKLVGNRVRLNPLSVTISVMFWGWLWGGIGLVLAVPITAAFKAICDNIESLKPFGEWLGT